MSSAKKQFLTILFFILSNFLHAKSYAKWANPEEASIKTNFVNSIINVNQDGTSEEITEQQSTILKESGRQHFATYRMYYDGDSEELKLIEAKTITQGKEYPVDLKLVEDQPLASIHQGFDQHRQLMISFPNLEIGSTIYLKFNRKVKKTILDNFYDSFFYFGQNEIAENIKLKITSAIPLKLEKNDPTGALSVSETTQERGEKKKIYNIEISNTKPIYHEIVNENVSAIRLDKFTRILVSSMDRWEDLARGFSIGYNKVIDQKLPKLFEEIKEVAMKQKGDIDRINMVTSMLNEKIQYVGDWRSVGGKFFPRDLEKIASSQIGDCKDFSAATAAILRNMGYETAASLVRRGIESLSLDTKLPATRNFNHAMVVVRNDKGKLYWIDPTNVISMAGGIFSDIGGKMALVLNEKKPSYEKIANIDYDHAKLDRVEEIEIKDKEVISTGTVSMAGEVAALLTGAELFISTDNLRDQIFHGISGNFLMSEDKIDLKLPELKSRIVSDISFSYKYKKKDELFLTNLGEGYNLSLPDEMQNIINTSEDQISDILISHRGPMTIIRTRIFKNLAIASVEKLNTEMDSKWVKIQRKAKTTKAGTEITIILAIKDNIIYSEDLKTLEYKKLKEFMERNFKDAAVIVTKVGY